MHRRILFTASAAIAALSFAAWSMPDDDDGGGGGSGPAQVKVVAWNDLGMHCMDSDYGVFSILPPFNNVHVQMIDAAGALVTDASGLTVTYEGVVDPAGSINTTSIGKTNYWQYAGVLYGASSVPDTGLVGNNMPGPGNVPQLMAFDAIHATFVAAGIPITPYDDAGHKRPYPLLRVVARDTLGTLLASTTPVVPVSDEMDCRACHGSGSGDAAKPAAGWVFHRDAGRDYRLNILRLHDEKHLAEPAYQAALATAGYSAAGLYDQVVRRHSPILCARCHASNALPGTGISGIPQLTTSMHDFHAAVADPETGLPLESSSNRASCYRCHPGSTTRCLRGAMGSAVASDGALAIQCQNCHGSMSHVGAATRVGWLDQPNCQACHTGTATHNNGQIRYTDVFESDGTLRQAVDATYATNPDAPAAGFSLYRFSYGHGGLNCEACHGSTHAEYPAIHANDNVQSIALQGHVGMLSECTACHDGSPDTVNGGPHGMHPVGQPWIEGHKDPGEHNKAACQACHGIDYRGTVLSNAQADRTLDTDDFGTKSFFRGARIGCYACHDGPDDENASNNRAPAASNASAGCVDQPVAVPLVASDPDNDPLTLRIVRQPQAGRVGLSGSVATYIPDPGFAGTDTFTFAAWDGSVDSNLATVTITRGATWANFGLGYPGTGGVIPDFLLDANPSLGALVHATVGNPSGQATLMFALASAEVADIETRWGGVIVTEMALFWPGVLPAGGLTLDLHVPADPALTGFSEFLQILALDPGALYGVAFTRGLRLTLGS